MDGAIEVRNLEISYGGEPVIRDVTTAFESGTFIGLIGPNGAGKSTLLMSISGQFKSTHVLQVIEKICDRFLVLKQGQIVADLGAENLKQSDGAAQDFDLEEYIIQLLSG